jgi:O-antigen/teichoic acid export membrane protein
MIGRKASLDVAVNLLCHAVGFVGLYFVTRRMGPGDLGLFAFGFAFVGLFGFLGDMGFGVAYVKRLSEGRDSAPCVGTYLALKVALVSGMCLAVVTSVMFKKHVLGRPFASPAHETMIYLALAAVACGALADVARSTFTARRQTAKRALPLVASALVEVAFKVAVAIAGFGAVMLGGASLAGACVLLLLSAWLFRSEPIGRPDWSVVKGYAVFALPVMVIVGVNAVMQNMDKLMIQAFCDTEAVGIYEGATKIAMLVALIEGPVGMLMFPTISAYHGARDTEGIRALTQTAERYLAMVLLPVGVVAVSMRDTITRLLLGDRFEASAAVFAFLVVAVIVRTVTVPYSSQIIGMNRPGMSAALSIVLLVLNGVLNLVLIPARLGPVSLAGLGAGGAALATALASLGMAVICRLMAARIVRVGFPYTLLKQSLAAVLMAAALHGLRQWGVPGSLVMDAVCVASSLGVYLVALVLLRAIQFRDISYLFGLASPAAMKAYIIDELRTVAPAQVVLTGEGEAS